MKKYDTYKDSGIEWIGMIPEGWRTSKLKYEASIVLGKMLEDKKPKGNINTYTLEYYLKSRNIGMLEVFNSPDAMDKMWFNSVEKELYELHDGDIVMNEGGDIGKVSLWKDNGLKCYLQNSVHKITPKKGVWDSTYMQYLLCTISGTGYFTTIVNAISIAHLTKEKLSATPLICPPLLEQQAIASYLDHKAGQIDASVSAIDKQIEDLKAYRMSVISEAVTKGLNPNASMKDSGIEWIGMIPEYWKCLPMKRGFTINNGKDYKDVQSEEGYPVIGSGGPFAYAKDFLYDGEAVLLGRKGTIDKPMYINTRFWTVDTMFYAVPSGDVCCKYMYYQALTIPFGLYSTNTALPSMTQSELANNPMCFPPLSEQQSIAAYLDEKTQKIDAAITSLEQQREDLKALKQSIISEAVTGKIDVRDWKPNNEQ